MTEDTDWEGRTVYGIAKKGVYMLTEKSLAQMLSTMDMPGTEEERISRYLIRQTGLPSSWSEGEMTYPMYMADFIPYADPVTGKAWLISQDTTPALYSISLSDPSDTQFRADGTAYVTLPDGTAAAGLYFSRGVIDVNGYLRTRAIDGMDHIEASAILFKTETETAYAVIRSRDMKAWETVDIAEGGTIAAVLEEKGLYPMDFMDDGDNLLMTLFSYGDGSYSFAFGRYDIATATLEVLPHEKAVLSIQKESYPFIAGGFGTPVYRYPLIRIGTRIYGTSAGLNLFSYDTETKAYTDLTGIFTELDISTSESSSPDEFFASRNNPLLSVVVPAAEAPDYRAVMMASPDLALVSIAHIPGTERLFLAFLSSGAMAIPAEYDTETGKLTVHAYASPRSVTISESMMTAPLFSGGTVRLGLNGILLFRGLDFGIPPFTAPNLQPSDIAELMIGKPTVTDTATAEFSEEEGPIVPYTAYPVNADTFIIGLASRSSMGFYTLDKAGFESLVSSHDADPFRYCTPFEEMTPYMTILFHDYDGRRTHFWSMMSHTVFDMDTGDILSTGPFTMHTADGTAIKEATWSYGVYARSPMARRGGRFQATVMTGSGSGYGFYHVESVDGTEWTATLMREQGEEIESIYAGSIDIGDAWLLYRYSPASDGTSIAVDLCLAGRDGTDTVLASDIYPITDEGSMFRALVRPALIELGGRLYAALPRSVVSWAPGEEEASAEYTAGNLLIDIIQSDNGLIIQEYEENGMRFRDIALDLATGEAEELRATDGRMFDYICARAVFSDGGIRVSTHVVGDAVTETGIGLMAVAEGISYSVTVAGIDSIDEWLTSVIMGGGLSRYLHIYALYYELYMIINGMYDSMNESGRAIGIPDGEIRESAFMISDSAVVDIHEEDGAIAIRLLPFSYEGLDGLPLFSELTAQPSALMSSASARCWYIGNPGIVKPFLVIHKDSDEPVGVTFHWNFPAQLTSTSPDALLRAPILRDGAMNSNADTAIPDSFIDALPED